MGLEEVTRQGLESIIAWSTGGTTFTIHNQSAFEQWIMPLYFSGMSSYKSFRRQLNLYGIYQHRHRPTQDANGTGFSLCVCVCVCVLPTTLFLVLVVDYRLYTNSFSHNSIISIDQVLTIHIPCC